MRSFCFFVTYALYIPIDVFSQDPLSQYPGYATYAASNPYHPLVNQSVLDQAKAVYSAPKTGCHARVKEKKYYIHSSHNKILQFRRSLHATMEGIMEYVRRRNLSVTLSILVHWLGIMTYVFILQKWFL